MKRIQNHSYANTGLAVRGTTYQGDAKGVFEMEDTHADQILETRGWAEVSSKVAKKPDGPLAPAATPAEPPAASEPAAAPGEPPEPPAEEGSPAAPEAPVEGTQGGEEEPGEGPDLSAMTTKKQLLDVAAEYGVELTAEQKKLPVDELRKVIDSGLYE